MLSVVTIITGRVAIRHMCVTIISENVKETLCLMKNVCKLKYFESGMMSPVTKVKLKNCGKEHS